MIDYQTICQELLQGLDSRKKVVLQKRFGLADDEPLTLQAIGDDLDITRERVRQIENDAILWLRERKRSLLNKPFQQITDYLNDYGGLRAEQILLEDLGKNRFQNHVLLFLNLGDDFKRFKESDYFYTLWAIEEQKLEQAKRIIESLVKELEKRQALAEVQELVKKASIDQPVLVSYIDVSKYIFQSPFGYYGLAHWPEVKPKGLKDKAYLVLKKEGEPLHFKDIAKSISKLPGVNTEVLPESVHNELIRNEKFVLIGRGIYALKEWGYSPGTVRDVIAEILKKEPLTKEKIVEKVLEQRNVKESTILLNLQNRKYFEKNKQGKYTLAK